MNIKKDALIAGVMFLLSAIIICGICFHKHKIHKLTTLDKGTSKITTAVAVTDELHSLDAKKHHKAQIHMICEALRNHNHLPDTTVHALAHEIEVLEDIDAE